MKITNERKEGRRVWTTTRNNNEAVKISDLEKNSEGFKVVRPKGQQSFSIREGVDELTLREGGEGMQRSFIPPPSQNVGEL